MKCCPPTRSSNPGPHLFLVRLHAEYLQRRSGCGSWPRPAVHSGGWGSAGVCWGKRPKAPSLGNSCPPSLTGNGGSDHGAQGTSSLSGGSPSSILIQTTTGGRVPCVQGPHSTPSQRGTQYFTDRVSCGESGQDAENKPTCALESTAIPERPGHRPPFCHLYSKALLLHPGRLPASSPPPFGHSGLPP